ncbi:MAG TPA: hypothetical protein VLT90_00695 [Terriglobales bacterium]|nr:hypothetical protein [Terriglobales bacterium]
MNLFSRWMLVLLAGAALMPVPRVIAQDTASKIKSEAERLQKVLKDKPISDPNFAQVGNMVSASLQSSIQAAHANHFYVSLESLAQAEDLLGGMGVIADKGATVKNNLPAFESEWGTASLRLATLDREAHNQKWENAPVAIRALSEAAQGKAIPLLDGGRGFATAMGPSDGLFYVGEAQGEADFARFCATLGLTAAREPFPLRSFLPELQSLQTKANAAFQPPRSIEQHPRFIALNSTIKLAEELDSTRFYAGAIYQYLEAVRHYGMLDQQPLDAAGQAKLKAEIAAAQKKFFASQKDDSIGQLFLERAESQVTHADGTAPSADEWRSAQVILDQVLPAYEAARKPASPMQRAAGKTVEITLVRWPYT